MTPLLNVMLRTRVVIAVASVAVLAACGRDRMAPGADPVANLKIVNVQFTQAVQDVNGSVPLIEGSPAVANVTIARSRDTLESSVPVVLRLFRSGVLVRSDTARTVGPLNPSTSLNYPTVQFLIPGSVVTEALSWQIEIDPRQTQPDSARSDNKMPAAAPAPLNVLTIPPLRIRFVPITLGANGNTTGDVTAANVQDYLQSVHRLLPVGQVIATVGAPLTTQTSFGTPPIGGDRVQFWFGILAEVSLARTLSRDVDANWYGIVGYPPGFTDAFFNGLADIGVIRSGVIVGAAPAAVGVDLKNPYGPQYARTVLAHELGHNFGRFHAPGCNALPIVDSLYPNRAGNTVYPGFDVWSWSAGLSPRAQPYDGGYFDLMSYCSPQWISPYTYQAILDWRIASAAVVTRTVRAPAIVVQGTLSPDGAVTLLPAVEGDATIPAPSSGGDITVDVRDANGAVLATTSVMSSALDHAGGMRHFLAVLPAAHAATATQIVARSRAGRVAVRNAVSGGPALRIRRLAGDVIDVQSDTSRAVVLRDDVTGDVIAIGRSGHATVRHSGPVSASVSNGVRSVRVQVTRQ